MIHSRRQERWVLNNGLTVLYRYDKDFPLVYATHLFKIGSLNERAPDAGLCSMTVDLLMQGTRRHNAKELARQMESVGASMGTQVHEDYAEAKEDFDNTSKKFETVAHRFLDHLEAIPPSGYSSEIATLARDYVQICRDVEMLCKTLPPPNTSRS